MDLASGKGYYLEEEAEWKTVLPKIGQLVEVNLERTHIEVAHEVWATFLVIGLVPNKDGSLTLVVRYIGCEDAEVGTKVEEIIKDAQPKLHLCPNTALELRGLPQGQLSQSIPTGRAGSVVWGISSTCGRRRRSIAWRRQTRRGERRRENLVNLAIRRPHQRHQESVPVHLQERWQSPQLQEPVH